MTYKWKFVSSSRRSEERSEWRGQYGWDRRISRSSPLRAGALAASGVAQTHMRGLQDRWCGADEPIHCLHLSCKTRRKQNGDRQGRREKRAWKAPLRLRAKDDSMGMILVVIGYVCVLFLTRPTEQQNNMLYIPTCVRRPYA